MRKNCDGSLGCFGGSIQLEHEVAACLDVPGLNDRGVVLLLQLPGDPLSPAAVSTRVADEKVFAAALLHSNASPLSSQSIDALFVLSCMSITCFFCLCNKQAYI